MGTVFIIIPVMGSAIFMTFAVVNIYPMNEGLNGSVTVMVDPCKNVS